MTSTTKLFSPPAHTLHRRTSHLFHSNRCCLERQIVCISFSTHRNTHAHWYTHTHTYSEEKKKKKKKEKENANDILSGAQCTVAARCATAVTPDRDDRVQREPERLRRGQQRSVRRSRRRTPEGRLAAEHPQPDGEPGGGRVPGLHRHFRTSQQPARARALLPLQDAALAH